MFRVDLNVLTISMKKIILTMHTFECDQDIIGSWRHYSLVESFRLNVSAERVTSFERC